MIKIILNNEVLDIDDSALVTFKKSQQLNGIQGQYSYSNNIAGKNSSKNRRLLGITYLPNSKAKSMTTGYTVDVVFNGCIFLKNQTLKAQKELPDQIPLYLMFTDNNFMAKAKGFLMNQLDTGVEYTKNYANFINNNLDYGDGRFRTAPISAQDESGLIVVEEIPALMNIRDIVLRLFTQLGYAYTGDILTDENIGKYYMSSNVGVYGPDGKPRFEESLTAYDFIISFLETFNGFIEVSDSAKLVGLYLWKNIETIKERFVDYSDKFVGFKEYTFEGGLAKTNAVKYSDSPDFYNGFFNNNKSILDKADYLNSDFGAGNLRLFDDQEPQEDGTLEPRVIGLISDAQTINIFKFEQVLSSVPVYQNGVLGYTFLYKAVSPNVLEIWQLFHQAYTNNIALPTAGLFTFRYDAIFLSRFKMQEVFFVKQLSTYWLPLELNFTTKKDEVKIKCLMIEKTPVDIPVVFDFNLSVDFYGEAIINNIDLLYAAYNTSPAATMLITGADLTRNNIFVNDIQILAFPTSIDVSAGFEFRVESIGPENDISNSNVFFQFVSAEGGASRIAKINVAHNGRANFLSEFRSELDVEYTYGRTGVDYFYRWLNYAAKVTTPINIADTYAPLIGDVATLPEAVDAFKVLQFDRASTVSVQLRVSNLSVYCTNEGGGAEARTKVYFDIIKNGAYFMTVFNAGAIDSKKKSDTTVVYSDIYRTAGFNVAAGDSIAVAVRVEGTEESRPGSGHMGGSVTLKNENWKFYVTEQL